MIAVLPSAGLATRLRPFTDDIPKAMIRIDGKPILEHHIENLKKIGVSTFCINLHHKARMITDYFGDGIKLKVKIHYSFEKELLGTAGLLNNFRKILKSRFWFIASDSFLPDFNYLKMEKFHESKKSILTIPLIERFDRLDCDFVLTDANSKITKIFPKPHRKKPSTNLDTCMVYLVEPEILSYVPRKGRYDFPSELIPKLIARSLPVFGYLTKEFIEDIGVPERYEKIGRLFKS